MGFGLGGRSGSQTWHFLQGREESIKGPAIGRQEETCSFWVQGLDLGGGSITVLAELEYETSFSEGTTMRKLGGGETDIGESEIC